MPNIQPKKSVLPNGVRYITAQNKATDTVTVLFFFETGSRYENPKLQGISHFLEHMMFKGTKKRPNTHDISKQLDAIGADFNAFTSVDHTGYYIKAHAKHLDFIFEMLSDILLHSKFDAKELAREKGPIIEEIKMYNENPMAFAELQSYVTLFGNSGVGRPIAGSEKTVSKMTRQNIVDYYRAQYNTESLIVGVAGNISQAAVKRLVHKHLRNFSDGKHKHPKQVVPKKDGPKVNLFTRPLKQVNAVVTFPVFGHMHEDAYVLRMLSIILGGSMSSRLFIQVRERKGLCYYIRSSIDFFEDTGGLFIQSGLDARRIDLALRTILSEVGKLKRQGPTARELADAKEQIKGRYMIRFEDTYTVAETLVEQEAFQKGSKTLDDLFEKYDAVTVKDVQRVAKDIFQKKACGLTMVGPVKNASKFEAVIKKAPF